MKIAVLAPLAIPVGHRIRVRWFHIKTKGVFGGDNEETRPTEPQIEDLETGVVYSFGWLHDITARRPRGEASGYSETLSEGVEPKSMTVGRVTACRLITDIDIGTGVASMITEITIAEEANTTAYR